jgi:pimeloyl-ACP methyl ester carboxylesterase
MPLILCQHFVGTMDSWDPEVVDGLARGREVILFDNAGVAASGGAVPTTIEGMADYAAGLLRALDVTQADVLGFSMGSLVAQQLALAHPDTVRRVILIGSGPRGGVGMATLTPEFQEMLGKKHDNPDDLLLDVFFTPSASSQAAGRSFVQRLHARTVDRDKDIDDKVAPAQVAAFSAWGKPQDDGYLKRIRQPVLVVSGSHDIVHYTVNSYDLQQKLPNAQLIVYPDSNHGAIYQYPGQFLAHATLFLDGAAVPQR